MSELILNKIEDLRWAAAGTTIRLRARIYTIRSNSNFCFVVLRQQWQTVQGIIYKRELGVDKFKEYSKMTTESIIDIEAVTQHVEIPVKSCTIQHIELHIIGINLISVATKLPIQPDERIYLPQRLSAEPIIDQVPEIESKLFTRLNHRTLDLRKADNKFIFRFQAAVSKIIRNYLENYDFMEIHTPKIIETASEGGANVFKIDYFGKEAYLAQSPQFYKQMAICGDFKRVYEIGSVFRAEKSFTHRHLTEYTGIDIEMEIEHNYHEVLNLLDRIFQHLFKQLVAQFGPQLEQFYRDFEVEPIKYATSIFCLTYAEAINLLRKNGIEIGDFEDMSTTQEKLLGHIIKEKYDVDLYVIDKFPTSIRPFYTMPSLDDPRYANAFDVFLRGEEIISGSQRIHDHKMLLESATRHGVDQTKIAGYLESFEYATPPHGGAGIGLERLVMFYLGLNNIRNASLFPRDPNRLSP